MKKDLRKLTAWMLTLAMLITLIPGFTIGAGATDFFEITEVDEVELMAEEISAPTFSADIHTVSYTNGEGLAGAKMQLLNSEDRVVDEWTSTEEIHTIEGLAAGNEYTVRVITAPKGFILSSDRTFSFYDDGKMISTGMVDEEGTILVGFDKTKLVIMTEGVVFDDESDKVTICFLNSEGSSVSSLDMTSESHELSGIPTGVEFTLHVADAPVGYVLPEDEKFTIDVDGWVDCSGNTATDEYGNNAILLKFEPGYKVTIEETINGTVEADVSEARKGETVTLTVTPATGYELDTLSVEDSDSEDVEINENKFTMPEADVTVTATFKKVYDVFVGGTGMEDGTYLASGASETAKKKPSGGYAYYKDGTLTLNDYSYEGDGYHFHTNEEDGVESYALIYANSPLGIVLEGTNKIVSDYYYGGDDVKGGIISESAAELTISGDGTIYVEAEDGAIYADGDIRVKGGKLDLVAFDAIMSGEGNVYIEGGEIYLNCVCGITADETVEITGGKVDVFAEGVAIWSYEVILSGGTIELETWDALMEAMDVSISEDLELILPSDGEIIRAEGLPHEIRDGEGNPVKYALLAPVCEHNWSEEYRVNSTHHWNSCTKGCIINDYPDACEGYEPHSEDGECICGYDVNKEAEIYIGGVGLANGEYLSTGGALSYEKPRGGYAYYNEGTLSLKDFEFKGLGYDYEYDEYHYGNALIYTEDDLDIVITGESKIETTLEESDCIWTYGVDITVSGKGSLTLIAGDDAINIYEGDVTIKSGTLTLETKDDDGIDVDGGNLYIKGGTINITTDDHGMDISASADSPDGGNVTITGGKITINAGDEGFDVEKHIKITGGTINVTAYDMPIDAYSVYIKGGKITLVSETSEGIRVLDEFEMKDGTLDITAAINGIEAADIINSKGTICIDGGEVNATVTEGYALFALKDIDINKELEIKVPKNAKIIDVMFAGPDYFAEGVAVGKKGEGAKEVEIVKQSSGGSGGGSSKGSSSSGGIKIPTGTPTLPVTPASGEDSGQTSAKKEFTDVHPFGHWATEDIDYVYENGIMKGISETEFAPEASLTRAMLVTVLYRLEGEPAVNKSIPFSDVDMGAYYADAVSWAKQVGIVKGVSDTEFAPDSNITREQIATIMHRFAEYKGYDVTQGGMLIREFNDYEEISEYALTAMAWTVNSGLFKGKGENNIAPEENATRAETAAILHRFIEGNK